MHGILADSFRRGAAEMIVSASRRTDIPAFYAEWMVRRIRDGYCYAVTSFGRAKANFDAHDPESPSLLGRGEAAG
jgi:hypothetical protein